MTKQFYVLGNWKSHGDAESLRQFETAFTELSPTVNENVATGLALPFHLLSRAIDAEGLRTGAQNVSAYGPGAFTGEIHAEMLVGEDCHFCLVGHSERRQIFGETIDQTAEKLARLAEADLLPVLCIGETLEQRQAGELHQILEAQLAPLKNYDADRRLIVAYEPVWAIGTGVAAQPGDVAEAHAAIKAMLDGLGLPSCPVLYGGSVKPGNASELGALDDVDGFLIGGASLKAQDFCAILGHFNNAKNSAR